MKVLQESYSVAEVQELFHITEDEARKLVEVGIVQNLLRWQCNTVLLKRAWKKHRKQ